MSASPKTFSDVQSVFDKRMVTECTREELEQLLIAIARQRILDPVNQARVSQMGETIRQLLAARQSQELHQLSLRLAVIALVISLAALICSAFQAYFSWKSYGAMMRTLRTPSVSTPP
jgi:hypothetical protein